MNKRPNILLMLADHARHDAVACNLDPGQSRSLARVVQTPCLDGLARGGVTFSNSYTTNPICVPARASITTGNYSHRATGSKSNGGSIRDDQIKVARLFADNGYATCAIGKLHYVPYSPPGQARLLHGFEYAELNEEGRIVARFDPTGEMKGLEDYHDYLKTVGWGGYERAHGAGNNDVHATVSPLPAQYYSDSWVGERSIAWLDRHLEERADQPFLLVSSFAKPHSPYDPPRPYDAMYDPREVPAPLGEWENQALLEGRDPDLRRRKVIYGWDKLPAQAVQVARACYCGMMSFQDKTIGRLLDYLAKRGLADETIVVYTADHGDLLGDFGSFFKVNMFDGAAKVPLIWRAPGVIPEDGPHARDQFAASCDILPTLCALTGVALSREVDGTDLTPILRDPCAKGREYLVSQTMDSPQQKYMVRTPRWKYIYIEQGGIEQLYDVTRPDYELYNLAAERNGASVVVELRQLLVRWCRENGDEAMLKDGGLAVSSCTEEPPEFQPGIMGWRKY